MGLYWEHTLTVDCDKCACNMADECRTKSQGIKRFRAQGWKIGKDGVLCPNCSGKKPKKV